MTEMILASRLAIALVVGLLVMTAQQAGLAEQLKSESTFSQAIQELLERPADPINWVEQAAERNLNKPLSERDWFEGIPPDEASPEIHLGYWEYGYLTRRASGKAL